MQINSVRLQNIRAHQDSSYELSEGVNILIGPNACGKTTILESIAFMAGLSGVKEKSLAASQTDWQRIDLVSASENRTYKKTNQTRQFELNGESKKRLARQDIRPIVWFDPEELRLLRGSPQRRRDYFDLFLSKINPEYQLALGRYKRTLIQRNSLLKSHQPNPDDLFVWDLRLVDNAQIIHKLRNTLINDINQNINQTYTDLSGQKKHLKIDYYSQEKLASYPQSLLNNLKQNLSKDSLLGYTSSGTHRDDFIFYAGSSPAIDFASRGEVRTIMVALKIFEMQKLNQVFQTKPVVLFDDIFSELDGYRRQAFVSNLKNHQTIITTTDADIVGKNFTQSAQILAVETSS